MNDSCCSLFFECFKDNIKYDVHIKGCYGFCIGVVGLQAAAMEPEICRGIVILDTSLRMLHIKKQPWYGRPLIRSFQSLLRYNWV